MESRISIITLGVGDLARAVRFYRDGLGFPTTYEADAPIAFFKTAGVCLALYPFTELANDISPSVEPASCGFSGVTIAHNVRSREEVSAVLAQAEAAGATVVKPAQDVFWGGHSGYFSDPDGHYWEVAWNPFFGFAPDGSLVLSPPVATP